MALLAEMRRAPDAANVPRKVGRVLRMWSEVFPAANEESEATWDSQHEVAHLAPAVAPHHWRAAWRLTALIANREWKAKVRSLCHFARFHAALERVAADPERAIAVARQMPRQFRDDSLVQIAGAIFSTHRELAMTLYRAHGNKSYLAEQFAHAILPHDWRAALAEYRAHDMYQEHLLVKIIERAVLEDFALAESLAHELINAVWRDTAVRALVANMPPLDVPDCLALMSRPFYVGSRIGLFRLFDEKFRAWCGVLSNSSGADLHIERPDGENPYWEKLRAVLRRTEEDLPWALTQIRDEPDPKLRHHLYVYVAAEFCGTR